MIVILDFRISRRITIRIGGGQCSRSSRADNRSRNVSMFIGGEIVERVGLVPCAGKGSRLELPFSKEMFPNIHETQYSPLIAYTINAMKEAGIQHLIFTINPHKTDIVKYLGNGKQFDMSFTFCIHPEPRSLPESINEAHHLIKDKTIVFAMPDTYVQPSHFLQQLIKAHEKDPSCEVTLGCFKSKNPSKFGMVEIKKGRAIRIEDKPSSTQLKWMWGAMVWNPEFTRHIHQFLIENREQTKNSRELILTDALRPLLEGGKVNAYCFQQGRYLDLGTYDEIRKWSKIEKHI